MARRTSYSSRGTLRRSLTTTPQTRWRPARVTSIDFVLVDCEALIGGDRADDTAEAVRAANERDRTGEGEIVCVARVADAHGAGQPAQAPVEPEGREVGQGGRGGGALGQMGRGQPAGQAILGVDLRAVGRTGKGPPRRRRDDVRGQPGERVGDRLGISRGAEDAVDPAGGDRREEVLEIHAHDDVLTDVCARVRLHRPATREAVGGVMGGDPVEYLVQDPALDLLQAALGALDHATRPARAGDHRVTVVAQPLVGHAALQPARVGKPCELPVTDAEQAGESSGGGDLGYGPSPGPHGRLGHQPSAHPRRLGLVLGLRTVLQ